MPTPTTNATAATRMGTASNSKTGERLCKTVGLVVGALLVKLVMAELVRMAGVVGSEVGEAGDVVVFW